MGPGLRSWSGPSDWSSVLGQSWSWSRQISSKDWTGPDPQALAQRPSSPIALEEGKLFQQVEMEKDDEIVRRIQHEVIPFETDGKRVVAYLA